MRPPFWLLALTLLACAKQPEPAPTPVATTKTPATVPSAGTASSTETAPSASPTCPPRPSGPYVARDKLASWTSEYDLSSGIPFPLTAAVSGVGISLAT